MPQLIKDADAIWSKYIRLRDSSQQMDGSWVGVCISCDRTLEVLSNDGRWRQNAQCGHFVGRGNMWLRYDEYNTNLQCAHCNAWRDKREMIQAYEEAIKLKYGDDVITIIDTTKAKERGLEKYGRARIIESIEYAKSSLSDMLLAEQ